MWHWLSQFVSRIFNVNPTDNREDSSSDSFAANAEQEAIEKEVEVDGTDNEGLDLPTSLEKRKRSIFTEGLVALKEMIGSDLSDSHDLDESDLRAVPEIGEDPEAVVAALSIPETMEVSNRKDTTKAVQNLKQLPALASINKMLSSATANWDAELEDVASVIEQDPALSAKVLRLANSAYVAPASRVDSILQALHLLGLDQVEYLSTSMVTLPDMINFVESINWRNLWTHNFACGLLSKEIISQLGMSAQPSTYLGGLMHDLGKVTLSFLYPETYTYALKVASEYFVPLHLVETRLFGLTHEEAAGIYADSAKLPILISEIMKYHRNPSEAQEEYQPEVAVVSLANHFCKQFGIGFSGSLASLDGDTIAETTAWEILDKHNLCHEEPEDFEEKMEKRTVAMRREITDLLSGMI